MSMDYRKLLGSLAPDKTGGLRDLLKELGDALEDSDDEDYDDDDEDFDSDEESEVMEVAKIFGAMFSSVLPAEGKPKANRTIQMTKDKVNVTAKAIPAVPAVNSVASPPASGKTSVLPEAIASEKGQSVLVVVPNQVVLANLAVNGKSYVTEDNVGEGERKDVIYTDMPHFCDQHHCGAAVGSDTIVVFDEVQAGDEASFYSNAFATRYGNTNTVVKLYGHVNGREVVPENAIIRDSRVDTTKFDRNLKLYGSVEKLRKGIGDGENEFSLSQGNFYDTKAVIEKCVESEKYTLHALSEEVVGLDLPNLQAVYSDNSTVDEGKVIYYSLQQHVQFMSRAGRRGGDINYFVPGGKLPSKVVREPDKNHKKYLKKVNDFFSNLKDPTHEFGKKRGLKKRGQVMLKRKKKEDLKIEVEDEGKKKYAEVLIHQVEALEIKKEEVTKVDVHDKPLEVSQLAMLPLVVTDGVIGDYSFYRMSSLKSQVRVKDLTPLFLHNYNVIVKGCRKAMESVRYGGFNKKDDEKLQVYDLYLDMYYWLKENDTLYLHGKVVFVTVDNARFQGHSYLLFGRESTIVRNKLLTT